jgi:hypothetical protein
MIGVLVAATLILQGPSVYSISDISQEFSFYMDGRFVHRYLGSAAVDARNWGTLWKLDLSDANLLILAGGSPRVPYDPRSVEHVARFVESGGGLLLMADGEAELSKVARRFRAAFTPRPAQGSPVGVGSLAGQKIEFRGGGTLETSTAWEPLVRDGGQAVLLARRAYGRGQVLMGVRGLFGSHPDQDDSINRDWVRTLLIETARGKTADPGRRPRGQFAELTQQLGPLTLEFHEGTQQFADAIYREFQVVRKHLVDITSVEPSPNMITRLLLLPTGGGGFSSGERIGIGAWWGDYPTNRYPMIELIAHEAGHSWVLPHPEPVWNEPIATYLGILVGKRMGMEAEAQATLDGAIARARRHDPDMDRIDINAPGAPNDVVWGKTYWIFERLEERHGPGSLAKYFRAKRRLVAAGRPAYTMDDAVAVWSEAVGADLFPWFRSIGIAVDRSKTDIGSVGASTRS